MRMQPDYLAQARALIAEYGPAGSPNARLVTAVDGEMLDRMVETIAEMLRERDARRGRRS